MTTQRCATCDRPIPYGARYCGGAICENAKPPLGSKFTWEEPGDVTVTQGPVLVLTRPDEAGELTALMEAFEDAREDIDPNEPRYLPEQMEDMDQAARDLAHFIVDHTRRSW